MNQRLVNRKAGIGKDDLVARVEQRRHAEIHDRLAAGDDADVLGRDGDVARAGDVARDGLAQLWEARRRPVFRPALGQCFLSGFDDVRRGGEVGFTDFQMDDGFALLLERARFGQDFEGRLGPDMGHPVGELHTSADLRFVHGLPFSFDTASTSFTYAPACVRM